jgi:hypothetical protein
MDHFTFFLYYPDWGKPQELSVRIVGVLSEIRTEHLNNTSVISLIARSQRNIILKMSVMQCKLQWIEGRAIHFARIQHHVFHYWCCLVYSMIIFININLYNCSCNCICCSCTCIFIVFIVCSMSFVVCVVLCECGVLFCVMCVIWVLCLIVVPFPPGKNPFAFKINNNNN